MFNIKIFDISTIKFKHDIELEILQITTLDDNEIAIIPAPRKGNPSALMFEGFERLLSEAVVIFEGNLLKVGLYNPYTGTISAGFGDDARVYKCNSPLTIEASGLCGTYEEEKTYIKFSSGEQVYLTQSSPDLEESEAF